MTKIFLSIILLMPCYILTAQKADTLVDNDFNIYMMYSKVNHVNFRSCDELIVTEFINQFLRKLNFSSLNEFQKRREISAWRDTLTKWQYKFDTSEIFYTDNVRLIDEYNFDYNFFPFKAGAPGIDFSKNYSLFQGNSIKIYYTGGDKFVFVLKLSETDAEKLLAKKDKNSDQRAIYGDLIGNKIYGKDRQIFVRTYFKILSIPDEQIGQIRASKSLYAEFMGANFFYDKFYSVKIGQAPTKDEFTNESKTQPVSKLQEPLANQNNLNIKDSIITNKWWLVHEFYQKNGVGDNWEKNENNNHLVFNTKNKTFTWLINQVNDTGQYEFSDKEGLLVLYFTPMNVNSGGLIKRSFKFKIEKNILELSEVGGGQETYYLGMY